MEGVKASFADQRRLLDLADADLAAQQADHARRNPAQAARVKELLAERAKAAGVSEAVFDRGGNRYAGRVAAIADGAREGGLAL